MEETLKTREAGMSPDRAGRGRCARRVSGTVHVLCFRDAPETGLRPGGTTQVCLETWAWS